MSKQSFQANSSVRAERAAKYVDMLSHHFSKKVEVEKREGLSLVHFPMGKCEIKAENQELFFHCYAESNDALQAVRGIIDRHIPLLKHIKEVTLVWQQN